MSCRRFQFDLSACLDGRLPGARRGEVMSHVDKCPTCAQVWEEMQAAQSLVLGLEEHPVSRGFRDEVWNRIHAGEGAPEILLQEPVSIATKIRYGAIGAAAAALLLVAFHTFTQDGTQDGLGTSDPDARDQVANIDESDRFPPGPNETGSNIPRPEQPQPNETRSTRPDPGLNAEPLTAAALANHTVNEVTLAAKRLRLKRSAVLEHPSETPSTVWIEVKRDVQTIGAGLHFLQNLERERLVEFGGRSRACMSEAQQYFVRGAGPVVDSRQEIQKIVQSLTLCPLEDLDRSLRYTQRATVIDPFVIQRILQHQEIERFLRENFRFNADFGDGRSGTLQLMIIGNRPATMQWQSKGRVELRTVTPDDRPKSEIKGLKKR